MLDMRSLEDGDRVSLRPATDDEIRARSRGPIAKNPIAWDVQYAEPGGVRSLRAERGGFHCERLFGPLEEPDSTAFAHLELGVALQHPWLGHSMRALPVLPAAYRRFRIDAQTLRLHDLTFAYGGIYQLLSRAARMIELGAPDEIVQRDLAMAQRDLAALFDGAFAEPPRTYTSGARLESLAPRLGSAEPVELEVVLFALGLVLERLALERA